MASDGRPDCSCCSHGSAAPHSVQQTLDEMDFERGIWSAAVDGDLDRVRTFLLKGTDPNTVDRAGYTALGANLQGVKMLCSNAEGASLRGCNFEDPSGLKANLEGANLKNVDMEGSQMTGINLRVATLKNAKLKNCNLRGATLAGTDLENCDLSGCDLQEANLRGSNVKGAIFEEMLTPLHMSQSVR
ncbi:BTB/POZ domain-containing protein KCTD9 [Acipenser ruthenus]|uniref:BTB/POZ domain-containing protein KCTD9 n=1 Tax=Acipenser ruthenus TaxID=7906 RepID=A0A444V142_ACIRT|nr:BTB/POZ domain-containing protein KCTD9 [Acipenser ruthenus]